jgi:hypothetical protein
MKRPLLCAVALLSLCRAASASIDSVTFTAVPSQATAGLASYTATLAGGYDLGDIDWNGLVTPLQVGTYGSELLVKLWWSGGPQTATIRLGTGGAYPAHTSFSGISSSFMGVANPAGTWHFDFYEDFDDLGDGLPDALWNTIALGFNAQPAHLLFEGFEDTVPPAGWTSVVNNSHTWTTNTYRPPEGAQSATCLYDPTLTGTQDEWLVSPVISTPPAGVALGGKTSGNPYWAVSPYDNYDIEVWLINGAGVNDGDDVLVGKLDSFWKLDWEWSDFQFDLAGLYTPGQDFRFAFRYHGRDGAQGSIDAIVKS